MATYTTSSARRSFAIIAFVSPHPARLYVTNVDLQADLYRECPFWQENGLCMNKECGIETIDEVC